MLKPFLTLFLLMSQSLFAQTLSGFVFDAVQKVPLIGANILLVDQQKGTVSQMDGRFEFKNLNPQSYRIRVSYTGYEAAEKTVEVTGDVQLNFYLKEAQCTSCDCGNAGLECPEIIVDAPRLSNYLDASADAYPFSALQAKDLENRQSNQDFPTALSTTPSITTYSENGNGMGYSTLRMRGFDQRRIAVSVNGIPQNEPEDHNVYWVNFYDIQQIASEVQVQRGASGAFYGGNGIGGAINIVAHPYQAQPFGEAEVGYGHFNTQRYSLALNTGLQKGWIGFARFSHVRSDGYRVGSWTQFYRFFAGITKFTPNSTFILQSWGGPQKDGLAYTGIAKSDNTDETLRRQNYASLTQDKEYFHQPHLEAIYDRKISPAKSLNLKAYAVQGKGYFDYGATWRTGSFFRLPNLSESDLAKPLYELYPNLTLTQRGALNQFRIGGSAEIGGKNNLFGADFRINRSHRWGRIQSASNEIPQNLVGENDVKAYSAKGEKISVGLYVKWKNGYHKHAFQSDFRLSFHQYRIFDEAFFDNKFRKSYLSFHPRIGYSFKSDAHRQFIASLSYTSREPRLQDLYNAEEAGAGAVPQFESSENGYDFSKPLVKPEHLLNPELGWKYQNAEQYLSANLYWMAFWNEIVPTGGVDVYGYPRVGNAPKSRHFGIETEIKQPINSVFKLEANASAGLHRFIRFTEYEPQPQVRDGNRIAQMPQLQSNLRLLYHQKRSKGHEVEASLSGQFVGKQFVNNANGKDANGIENTDFVVDAFHLWNANLRYSIKNIALSIDLNNLLNQKIVAFGNQAYVGATPQFFPLAGFHTFVKSTIRF